MKVLVVGGTADGRYLATQLHQLGFDTTYSIAGVVRKSPLPCPVVEGGFTQFGGLQRFINANQITHIVDATDPFAQQMSDKVAIASEQLSIPAIRFQLPPWCATKDDKWIEITQWSEVIAQAKKHDNLLISAGQVTQPVIDALSAVTKSIVLRTAMPAKIILPNNVVWVKALGPFLLENERQLLKQYQIDAVISKNSGGVSTYAKMQATAALKLPVYQFQRPVLLPLQYEFDNLQSCIDLLSSFRN